MLSDLGAHIDGFIAVVGHTVVVGSSAENKVKGKQADVLLAAHYAAEAALRLVRPTGENYAVTDAVQKVAESYKCKPISGMLSHQLKQFKIDGEKSIIQNPTDAQKKEHDKCEFEVNEVYAIDVLVSTGEGKGRETNTKTSIYKRTDEIYQLKMKASRALLSEVDRKFTSMPFTLRALEDEKKAKLGVIECVTHKLLEPFNVLYEKEGELVAQFKQTVLLTSSGTQRITGLPLDLSLFESEHKVEDETLKSLLAQTVDEIKAPVKKDKPSKEKKVGEKGDAAAAKVED